MKRDINILITDDHPEFIEGVEMFLHEKKKYSVLGSARNGEELLNHPLLYKADVVLLDCEMPVMGGIEAAKNIDFLYPAKKLIAVTMHQERRHLIELLGAGFKGYIYKPDIGSRIESVIERVLNGEYVFDETLKIYKSENHQHADSRSITVKI
jgi:DNA-binding NarL/FixJ family response regulator